MPDNVSYFVEQLEGADVSEYRYKVVLNVNLYDVVKQLHPEYQPLFDDLTGFMWGWAVNAARHILKLGAVPNPAIITVGVHSGS